MTTSKSVNKMFLILVVLYIGMSFLIGSRSVQEMPMVVTLLISQGMVLVPGLLYCILKKISIRELIPFKKMKLSVWILVIVCTYLMYPLMVVLNAVSLFFVKSATAEMINVLSGQGIVFATLFMAVLPAFVEEFIFRGILFGTYKKSKMLPAIFLSAFLFGCMHMNLNQFFYAFALGIYLAFLVEATGSILSSMLAHFTINFTAVALNFLMQHISGALQQGTDMLENNSGDFLNTLGTENMIILLVGILFWMVIAIGTTAGAVGIFIAISKISGRWDYIKGMFKLGDRKALITLPLIITVILMFAVMLGSAMGWW